MAGMHAWIDISAGVAGDMLLGALLDAGADRAAVTEAIDAVAPASVRLESEQVTRAGQRATKARVRVLVDDPPHRTWRSLRATLSEAPLDARTRARSLAAFALLADAEARAHGIDAEDVHFHEVGALDSIADVIGTCAALEALGVESVSASAVALGAGRIRVAHGDLPVPVPAVAELAVGWRTVRPRAAGAGEPHRHGEDGHAHHAHDRPAEVLTDDVGELATPTGLALVRALAPECEPLPAMVVRAVGVGAGGRDLPGRPNVVRVMLGELSRPNAAADRPAAALAELRANVDDLDPRLWPGVLDACLEAGAADAWLVPIQMKKGRPAFTLHALADAGAHAEVVEAMLAHTTTLGVRESPVTRTVAERVWVDVAVSGYPLAVKVGVRDGRIVHATAEFAGLAALAHRLGAPEAHLAQQAAAAIVAAGLTFGAPAPASGRTTSHATH